MGVLYNLQSNFGGNGLDWLCYLAGNYQTATMIFFKLSGYVFFKDFIKNPQTTIALTFLTHIISGIDGVKDEVGFKSF